MTTGVTTTAVGAGTTIVGINEEINATAETLLTVPDAVVAEDIHLPGTIDAAMIDAVAPPIAVTGRTAVMTGAVAAALAPAAPPEQAPAVQTEMAPAARHTQRVAAMLAAVSKQPLRWLRCSSS